MRGRPCPAAPLPAVLPRLLPRLLTLLLTLVLPALAPPAAAQGPGLPWQSTALEMEVAPAPQEMRAGDAPVDVVVTLTYRYVPLGALAADPATAVTLAAEVPGSVALAPSGSFLAVPVEGAPRYDGAESKVAATLALGCRGAAEEPQMVTLRATAWPNGQLQAAEGRFDYHLLCLPAPPPAEGDPEDLAPLTFLGPPADGARRDAPLPSALGLAAFALAAALAAAARGARQRRL